jgi:hypothetical protein
VSPPPPPHARPDVDRDLGPLVARRSRLPGRVVALLAAALLTLAGCGDRDAPSTGDSATASATGPGTPLFGECSAADLESTPTRAVARADLDADGAADAVAHVAASAPGPCRNAIAVELASGIAAAPLGEGGLGELFVVRPPGLDRELLLVRGAPHPRGGFEQHLLGAVDGRLEPVTAGDEPLLGFVATDGGGLPGTARCGPDGTITVVRVSEHRPPGVVQAWDVRTTTFRIDGTEARRVAEVTEEAVPDPRLRQEQPRLFEVGAELADCRVPAGRTRDAS